MLRDDNMKPKPSKCSRLRDNTSNRPNRPAIRSPVPAGKVLPPAGNNAKQTHLAIAWLAADTSSRKLCVKASLPYNVVSPRLVRCDTSSRARGPAL